MASSIQLPYKNMLDMLVLHEVLHRGTNHFLERRLRLVANLDAQAHILQARIVCHSEGIPLLRLRRRLRFPPGSPVHLLIPGWSAKLPAIERSRPRNAPHARLLRELLRADRAPGRAHRRPHRP